MNIHHTHKTRMILQSNDAGAFREKCTSCNTTDPATLALPCFVKPIDAIAAERPTYYCPRWPHCGCPDGTVRHDCPALPPAARPKPAERASEPPRAAQTAFLRRDVPQGKHGKVQIGVREYSAGKLARYFIGVSDFMNADDLREAAHLFNQMAEILDAD